MKRAINPLWVLYLVVVFLPLGFVVTVICSLLTIIFAIIGDYRWGYLPGQFWGRSMCYLAFVRVEVVGQENYSKDESYIFIANHQSAYDIFVIYGWLVSRFKWIMKNTLRSIPLVGFACYRAGHIFIDRSNPMKAKQSIMEAERRLKRGALIVIFPEGSRSKTGEVGRFKKGAFKMAEDMRLPIVPISIKGAFEVMPSGSYYIKPRKITLTFHPAISTKDLQEDNMEHFMEKCRDIVISKTK